MGRQVLMDNYRSDKAVGDKKGQRGSSLGGDSYLPDS